MPKHKSVLREQAQQINFKSVLNCQNNFKSVFNLLGLFVEYTFGERYYFNPYIQKSFLVIDYYKKIWNRTKIIFCCAPLVLPPLSPPQSSVFQLLQDVKIRKKLSAFFVLKTVLTR